MRSTLLLVLAGTLSLTTASPAAPPNGGCKQYSVYTDPYGCMWTQGCKTAPLEDAVSYNKTIATDLDNCIDECAADARANGHPTGCQEVAYVFKGKHKSQCFFFNKAYRGTANRVVSYAYLNNCTGSA